MTDNRDVVFLIETVLNTSFGDLNLDGRVAFDDYSLLAANFGTRAEASWSTGDLNGNGETDFTDFLVLSANFGFEREVPAHG